MIVNKLKIVIMAFAMIFPGFIYPDPILLIRSKPFKVKPLNVEGMKIPYTDKDVYELLQN